MGYSGGVGTSELIDLLISFIVLTIAFSMFGSTTYYIAGIGMVTLTMTDYIIVTGIAVGTGFMLHELAHKFIAQRYGYWAEYKASIYGLILTFAMAYFIHIVFAAPGAVMIRKASYSTPYTTNEYSENDDAYWDRLEKKIGGEDLWISLAGPMTNIILTAFFAALLKSGLLTSPLLIIAAYSALSINLMLAAFNLIPIDPLDGGKIFRGNAAIWAIVAIPTILFALYIIFIAANIFGVIHLT